MEGGKYIFYEIKSWQKVYLDFQRCPQLLQCSWLPLLSLVPVTSKDVPPVIAAANNKISLEVINQEIKGVFCS